LLVGTKYKFGSRKIVLTPATATFLIADMFRFCIGSSYNAMLEFVRLQEQAGAMNLRINLKNTRGTKELRN
jgi:hypothetical protein